MGLIDDASVGFADSRSGELNEALLGMGTSGGEVGAKPLWAVTSSAAFMIACDLHGRQAHPCRNQGVYRFRYHIHLYSNRPISLVSGMSRDTILHELEAGR